MSFTAKFLPNQRHKYFTFFASDGDSAVAPDAEFTETFAMSYAFELEKIRIHLSTAHVSIVDMTINLSHHIDSAYNQTILSVAMLNVQDYEYRFDPTLKLHSGDVLYFSMIMSAINFYGLEYSGWAITKPFGGWS